MTIDVQFITFVIHLLTIHLCINHLLSFTINDCPHVLTGSYMWIWIFVATLLSSTFVVDERMRRTGALGVRVCGRNETRTRGDPPWPNGETKSMTYPLVMTNIAIENGP